MTREEEITQAALEMYSGAVSGHLAMRVGFETGAKWADENPKPNLVDIDKVIEWLKENVTYTDNGVKKCLINLGFFIDAMREE